MGLKFIEGSELYELTGDFKMDDFVDRPYNEILREVQANILIPQRKRYAWLINLKFINRDDYRTNQEWLVQISRKHLYSVTSLRVHRDEYMRRRDYHPGMDPTEFEESFPILGIYLTYRGGKALGIRDEDLPLDPRFTSGLKATLPLVMGEDPAEDWSCYYNNNYIHIGIFIASNSLDKIEWWKKSLEATYKGRVEEIYVEKGERQKNFRGHFGFVDGSSQPKYWPRKLGYRGKLLVNDLEHILARNTVFGIGSYLVFSKLEQSIDAYKDLVKSLRDAGIEDEKYAEAQIIGRFKDDMPLVLYDPKLNDRDLYNKIIKEFNNFKVETPSTVPKPSVYESEDAKGTKCPFHAHVRKANPRDHNIFFIAEGYPDAPKKSDDSNTEKKPVKLRITRRGIPYNDIQPSGDNQLGLIFLSFQASILCQFEKILETWIYDDDFPQPGTGKDPLLSLVTADRGKLKWNKEIGKEDWVNLEVDEQDPPKPLVLPKGGEYFFAPCLSFFKELEKLHDDLSRSV